VHRPRRPEGRILSLRWPSHVPAPPHYTRAHEYGQCAVPAFYTACRASSDRRPGLLPLEDRVKLAACGWRVAGVRALIVIRGGCRGGGGPGLGVRQLGFLAMTGTTRCSPARGPTTCSASVREPSRRRADLTGGGSASTTGTAAHPNNHRGCGPDIRLGRGGGVSPSAVPWRAGRSSGYLRYKPPVVLLVPPAVSSKACQPAHLPASGPTARPPAIAPGRLSLLAGHFAAYRPPFFLCPCPPPSGWCSHLVQSFWRVPVRVSTWACGSAADHKGSGLSSREQPISCAVRC